jgi:CPW-WPC domain-containing protein
MPPSALHDVLNQILDSVLPISNPDPSLASKPQLTSIPTSIPTSFTIKTNPSSAQTQWQYHPPCSPPCSLPCSPPNTIPTLQIPPSASKIKAIKPILPILTKTTIKTSFAAEDDPSCPRDYTLACPEGWRDGTGKGDCIPPKSYQFGCGYIKSTKKMSPAEKQALSYRCRVKWPCSNPEAAADSVINVDEQNFDVRGKDNCLLLTSSSEKLYLPDTLVVNTY